MTPDSLSETKSVGLWLVGTNGTAHFYPRILSERAGVTSACFGWISTTEDREEGPMVAAIRRRIDELPEDTILIEGEADGADANARHFAEMRGLFVAQVPVKDIHWTKYGRGAGHKRNAAMLALRPDLVIAFTNGTNGTQGTIDQARKLGIPVEVIGTEAPCR